MLPPFWDYRREYDELRDEILAAVDRVFRSGQLILGREGVAFERDMASYVGVTGGGGRNSGADGIYIGLAAGGNHPGEQGLTGSHNPRATARGPLSFRVPPAHG